MIYILFGLMTLANFFLIIKIDNKMEVDVTALTTNISTLNGLIAQLIAAFQAAQVAIQNGIDAQDLAAIQAANTSLTSEIAAVQAALPAAPAAPVSGS